MMIDKNKVTPGSSVLMTCFLALDTQLVDTLKYFANELRLQGASLVLASPDIERIRNETDLGFDFLALPQSLADYDATTYPIENIIADPFNTWLAEVDANWWNGVHGRNSRRSLEGLPHCTHVARQVMAALRPSIVLAWSSGVYPVSRVWQDVARQMGIPAFCLERGFLPGTWMIDEGGMNAQSDMRSHPLIRRTLAQHTSTIRIEAYRKWYQAARPRKYGTAGEGAQALRTKLEITGRMVVVLGSLDCAGLQPRSITGAEINSPGFADSRELILAVDHALENEPDLSILFKAHPGEKDNFPQGLIGRVQVIEDVDVIDLIQTADVIVAGLTGLTFETLLNKRPLVLVANSPLQGTGAAFEALTPNKLTSAIRSALLGSDAGMQGKADIFLDGLLSHCLYATDNKVPSLPLSELAIHCANLGSHGTANLEQAALVLTSVAPRLTQPAQEFAQLFFDTGAGFNETQSIKKKINRAVNRLTFELPTGTTRIQGLRFDPINDCALIKFKAAWLVNSHGVNTPLESHPSNASYQEGSIAYFDHDDPQLIMQLTAAPSDGISNVSFEFELIALGRAAEILCHEMTKKNHSGALQMIVNLNSLLVERDEQIVNLNQSVAVRDEQIVNLNQSVAVRDEQIVNLNQSVAVRDEQIVAILQTIAAIKLSTSWAITLPLRFISNFFTITFAPVRTMTNTIRYRVQLIRWFFQLQRCPLFNTQWYLAQNHDVSNASINPLWHYLVNGWKEGRQPGPEFDGKYYQARYLDIVNDVLPPLVHYWLYGRNEGRYMNSTLDLVWLQGDNKSYQHATTNHTFQDASDLPINQNSVFISVIIPTYNRIKFLPGIIDSWRRVHANTIDTYEIIFSDDGSSDGSVEYLETIKDLPLKILRNAHGGASSARNAAIRAACGERLLIIGDDIFPDQDILNVHAELGRQMGSNIAILGTVDWHNDIKINHLMHHITEIGNEQFSYNRLKNGSFIDFRHFYTCNISIDRHFLLAESAIFDERFNEYGFEDIELGYRLALRGLKIFFTTQATGEHYHPYNLAGFCRRQSSAGRMAVIFSNIHPGVDHILGIAALSARAHKATKSSGQDELWQGRVDMLISRCDEYEQLVSALPSNISIGIRQCLSAIYSPLFRATYEYGVLTKLGTFPNPLAISMSFHFKDSWNKYWLLLTQNIGQPINLNKDEIFNLAEALNASSMTALHYGTAQRIIFDELQIIKSLVQSGHMIANNKNQLRHLASRTFYYLINDPRYLAHRAKKFFLEVVDKTSAIAPLATHNQPAISAIPAIVFSAKDNNREEAVALFRAIFGDNALVYELTHDHLLKLQLTDGRHGDQVSPSATEATIFFWPTSLQAIPLKDHLLSAYIALVENGLSLAIISHSLSQEKTVNTGNLRDSMLFSRDVASAIFSGTLVNVPFKGKVLRLLPAKNPAQEISLDKFFGVSVDIDSNGFFYNQSNGSISAIRYKAPYLPARIKTKPVAFVFPIFLAVGGVERNTIEIMRQLRSHFDFVVITMERLRPEQGSLAAQAHEVATSVIEMSELVSHADYLRVLTRLKAIFHPDLVWVCNGSPWFCDNAASIRQIFIDTPIIDQEAYDTEQGWITRFNEPGIQSFDHFIAVNKKIQSRFQSDLGIGHDRNTLIYSAIDTNRILNFKDSHPDEKFLRAKFGLPQDKKIFTFIGRLTSQKRPLLFLNLAKSRINHTDECFVLVGDGELAPQALDYIKRHSLTNVIRIPYIDNTLELNTISDGIIFTSAYEGLPIAMLEALSMGVPAFSTDVGDIADVLNEYVGGEVIPPTCSENQLNEGFNGWLSRRSEYVANLNAHEREILNRFSSQNIAKQYVSCWQAVIAKYAKVAA